VHGKVFGEESEPSNATIRQLLVDMESGLTEIGNTFYTMSVDVLNTEEQAS
jgi:hypothetical protein